MADGFTVVLNGLDLTGVDANGVSWSTTAPLSGWGGSPGSSLQLTQKLRSPGAWVSPRQMTPRAIGLSGWAECPSVDALRAAQDAVSAAASLDVCVLAVTEGSLTRWCNVHRQDVVLAEAVTDTLLQWSVQVVAADPRKFTADLTDLTGLPASSGGLTFPTTVPLSIGSTVVSGQCSLINPGNTAGPVRLRIQGPIVGPQVTHVGTGLSLVFASSLTLGAGEWLDVSMEDQSVLANGQSSRNNTVTTRQWSGFEPGPNTWAFAAVSGSGTLTVTATPAWQ